MSLREVLARAFSGRAAPAGTLGSLIDEAKRLAGGSRRAAARAIGVAESTLRGWEKGLRRPAAVAKARGRAEVGVRKLSVRQDAPPDRITATIANPGRRGPATRTVLVDPEGIRRARDLWAAGDDNGAVREFRKAVKDDWYRGTLFRPQDDEDPDDEDSQETIDIETSEPYVGGVAW